MSLSAIPSSAVGGTPVTSVVDSFQPEGTHNFSYVGGQIGSVWSNWFGSAFQALAWDAAADADGNAGSGALKIVANFPGSGSNQFTVINGFSGISPSVSARQFSALECDVKFAAGSATVMKNGVPTFGHFELGMATPSYGQDYFGGVDIPASNTGWVHVSIPLNAASDANLYKITNVFIHIWGATSLSGASTLWVDNLKFTGTTVNGTATVNYANARQRIDGFGASSAWGSSWSVAEADLLFSTNANCCGLSLLRSRIAPDGSTVESGIMQLAQARGARVWSTPWSPPAAWKDSNSVNGGNWIATAANSQSYATQLATYVAAMRTTYGIKLHALSVQNEPDASTTYESCVWTAAQIHDFVPYLSAALAAKGVANTGIMLPESMHWQFALAADTMNDPVTAAQVALLGGHDYGSSAAAVTQFGSPPPVPLWETEHYFGSDDTIVNGVALAAEIHDFMTVAEASAYHYWWLKGSGNGSLAGNSTTTPAKRLYVMGNYARFVRPGFQRVTVTSDTTALISAFKDPTSQTLVIVAANPTAWPVTQSFDLTSCPAVTSLNPWLTSDASSLANLAALNVSGGVFTTELPAYSVTTFTTAAAPAPWITLKSSDAIGSTSFNAKGNWDDTVVPAGDKDYSAAQYVVRTPASSGNYAFGGHALTLPLLGILRFKGGNHDTITVGNLILDGGSIENGNAATAFTLAGKISVTADSIIYPANDATRAIVVAADIAGTGALTHGNGGVGTVSCTGNNGSFTGPMIVSGGATLQVASQINLGGNPAAFNPGQLTLANGVFQPTASFDLNRSNSGVTVGAGGGTFSINSGLALTIANPVVGSGALTKTGTGALILNGPDSHAGGTTVSAGNLTTCGLGGAGSVTVAAGATLAGNGLIAGNTSVSGTLAPAAPGLTIAGSLAVGSAGRLQWALGGNTPAAAGTVAAVSVTVTGAAKIDILLNGSGSTMDFLDGFWRSAHTFPLVTASAMTGTFTLGSVTADAAGRPVAAYGAFTLQNSAGGATLAWTPIPGFPNWALQYFTSAELADPSISGAGAAPAGDGLSNLLKYALGLPPKSPATAGITLSKPSTAWLVTYTRPANRPELTYAVEMTSDLANGAWTRTGVTHQRVSTGDPETWQGAYTPGPLDERIFFRLAVSQP